MSRSPLRSDYLCPKCDANLSIATRSDIPVKCEKCGRTRKLLRCPKNTCQFHKCMCYCEKRDLELQFNRNNGPLLTSTSVRNYFNISWLWWIAGFGVVLLLALYMYRSENPEDANVRLMRNLKKEFPSQRNETWCHFLSVLDKGVPSVKSITFLHGEDKRTSDCLIKKLVSLYSENKTTKSEEITFSAVGYEGMDYGFALEHYHLIVDTFRVFVTDLMKVPGNIARVFHSLCDEVSSDIKPSLFIFALKFDKRTEMLKPKQRAETILKETWSDLPENELFPLLSRIIRNVVHVVPEKEISCN